MKTLTITFHHTHNYGAVLQAYALQQTIIKLGHDNIIFEYPYQSSLFCNSKSSSLKSFIINNCINLCIVLRYNKIKKRDEAFKKFHKKLNLTRIYNSFEDFKNDYPKVDAFIVGSDQVWNLKSSPQFVGVRLLNFKIKDAFKISYAASIEKLSYTDSQKLEVSKALNDFKAISLREESAREYISKITDRDCERHIDPVFLLSQNEWNKLAEDPNFEFKYILIYQVQSVDDRLQKLVNVLKERTGYKTVTINPGYFKRLNVDYTIWDASPEQFLGYFKKATIVVSGSFHGAAFALIYRKPLYVVIKEGFGSRMIELLRLFNMEEYLITKNSEIPEIIDVASRVDKVYDYEVNRSIEYLKRYLNEDNLY